MPLAHFSFVILLHLPGLLIGDCNSSITRHSVILFASAIIHHSTYFPTKCMTRYGQKEKCGMGGAGLGKL